jgi:CDP-glucose 4,6-dehydratase
MHHFDKNIFKGKRILITGNTGFKGTWLSLVLHSFDADVYGIAKEDLPLSGKKFNRLFPHSVKKQFYLDVSEKAEFEKAFSEINPDLVFHLAAQPLVGDSYKDPYTTLKSNVGGTMNLLEILRNHKNNCLAIFITSDKCYKIKKGQKQYSESDELGGFDPYSFSKSMQERLVEMYHNNYWNEPDSLIRTCTLRCGNVIGGGDFASSRLLPDCYQSILAKKNLLLRNPEAIRPWIYILDSINAYLTATNFLMKDSTLSGESFNVGPEISEMIKVKDLVEKFNARFKEKDRIEIGAESEKMFHESEHLFLDISKIKNRLNWNCNFSIERSISETADWYSHFIEDEQKITSYTMKSIQDFFS